jgi:hypothetical protein
MRVLRESAEARRASTVKLGEGAAVRGLDQRTVAIERSVELLEREIGHFDLPHRIAVERVMQELVDEVSDRSWRERMDW